MEFPREPPVGFGLWIQAKIRQFSPEGPLTTNTYVLTRAKMKNGYASTASGGQIYWTDADHGPWNEPIIQTREWVATVGSGYIGSWPRWEGEFSVREFFERYLRSEIIEFMEVPEKGE